MTTTWTQTRSGKRMDFLAPSDSQVNINDIAFALSRLPRFCGHLERPYSVLDHSINAARVAHILRPEDVLFELLVLLHDAHEAYTGDIPTPLKTCFSDQTRKELKQIQSRLQSSIHARICGRLNTLIRQDSLDLCKQIDAALCILEAQCLFKHLPLRNWTEDYIELAGGTLDAIPISFVLETYSVEYFIQRVKYLTKEIKHGSHRVF